MLCILTFLKSGWILLVKTFYKPRLAFTDTKIYICFFQSSRGTSKLRPLSLSSLLEAFGIILEV